MKEPIATASVFSDEQDPDKLPSPTPHALVEEPKPIIPAVELVFFVSNHMDIVSADGVLNGEVAVT